MTTPLEERAKIPGASSEAFERDVTFYQPNQNLDPATQKAEASFEVSDPKRMKSQSEIVSEFINEVLNEGNIEATGRYFHEEVVEQVPFPGQGPGLQGLKEVLKGLRAAFPDMHWLIEEQIEEGAKVVTRFVWSGTHQGEFFGVPASGRPVSVWGVVIDRFVDGKISETRIIMDALGLMAQMGAFGPK